MKIGRDERSLAAEIIRQNETKKDFIANTSRVDIGVLGGDLVVGLGDKGTYPINDIAHDQIAAHTKIPRDYYKRMLREAPELAASNVEAWFAKYPASRLFRTLDGKNRAMLSDRYPICFDNYDFAEAALPMLYDRKLEIMSCDITDKKLYLKAVDKQLFTDVPIGYKMGDGSHKIFDTCAPVVVLSNSEVGFGCLVCETGIYTRGCTNLSLWAEGGMKRRHVGARHELAQGLDVDDLDEVMSHQTKRKVADALWAQVRDVIAAAFDTKVLGKRIEKLTAAATNKITGDITKVVEVAAEKYGLADTERSSVLKHLIEGGSLTQYGLHAAVTRAAADVETYDRATELEYLGGKIIELPRSDWQQLAEAA